MSQRTNSRTSQFSSLLGDSCAPQLFAICLGIALILSGCSWFQTSRSNAADDALFAQERQRLEAEKRAEREAAIRELLARNIPTDSDSDKQWIGFRKAYPYHSQTLAMSGPSADRSRTLIISEPPPQLTAGDMLLPLSEVLRNHSEKKQKIGYDGWVKDLVVEIAGDNSAVDSAISSLNRVVFETSYKAYVLPLPAKTASNPLFNLDLQVTTAELKRWALDDQETFTPIEGGESLLFQKLFDQKVSGVFYGDHGGLVAWFIPRKRTIDDCHVQARQFSLDSDLVVGALSNDQGILVLGRNRLIPVDVLPPLRVETLSLLGAVQQGQSGRLAQSYERNHLFAGRFEGRKDWAPILLSPELRDTEYGSLLNITDQLLKGWSNNGDTSYYNFNYPRPNRWPFKGSLIDELETEELTYNWNTRGAGYTVEVSGYRLLALNRTGALPVSYFPIETGAKGSPATLAAEDDAYNYFAKLNDPNLVRVVQYAAMYQIFSAFDVAKPSSQPPSNSLPDTKLEEMSSELLTEIRNSSPQEIAKLTRELSPLVGAQLNGKDSFQQFVAEVMKGSSEGITQYLQEHGYIRGTSEFDLAFREMSDASRERARQAVSASMEEEKNKLTDDIKSELLFIVDGVEADSGRATHVRKMILSQLAGLRKLPEHYAGAVDFQQNGWIHTPAVVVSWNGGALLGGVGGHNLDARVTRFRISDEVPPGTTTLDSEGNILVNSRDFDRVNSVVRTAGRAEGESPTALSSELNNALKQVSGSTPRSQATALNLAASPPSLPPNGPPRPPLSFAMPGPESGGEPWHAGWARPRSQISEPLQLILGQRRAESPGAILIDRDSSGLISVVHSERSPAIRATNPEDAVDVVLQLMRRSPEETQTLNIEFRGFQEQDARSFIKSCEVRATSEKIPREIAGVVDEAGGGGGEVPGNGNRNSLPGESGNDPENPGSKDGQTENLANADRESILATVKERKYDFSRAEVNVNPEVVVENGIQRSSITVEIPAADAGAPGRSTIDLGFRKSTPREVVKAGTNKVANSIKDFVKGIRNEFQALSFNLRLNAEVKRVAREMDIDIEIIRHSFDSGKGDLYFARREDMDEPPKFDSAAC